MTFFAKMVRALFGRGGKSRRRPARAGLRLHTLEARAVPSAYGDFNGDGYDDLAIGVPGEDYASYAQNSGAVNVIYGSYLGLNADGNQPDQFWTQESYGVQGFANANDQFGAALAVGDFNGDGYADLAIGVPGESGGAGAVNVLHGSPQGLHWNYFTYNQYWQQGSAALVDAAEAGDQFGASLTAGDFNSDGYADLAVGVPGEDVGTKVDAGAAHVLYGSAYYGLTSTWDQLWSQGSPGVPGQLEASDGFGSALAAGDFNGDGEDDLAVGVPSENDEDGANEADVGAVTVIYGSHGSVALGGGLSVAVVPAQSWTQDSSGIEGTEEAGDRFGHAVAAGDFNGDGRDDLAIGVPGEDDDGTGLYDVGAVSVIYGSHVGLNATYYGNQYWQQGATGLLDAAEVYDQFGSALAVGDFNGDGKGDLAVGVPLEDVGAAVDAGAVNVLYGLPNSYAGLWGDSLNQFWHQDSPGIEGVAGSGDGFGRGLGRRK
jgi:hypothetical protein